MSVVFAADQAQSEDISSFIQQLSQALEAKDITRYLSYFAEDIRAEEQIRLQSMYEDFKMDKGELYLASQQERPAGGHILYVRLFFQNPTFVILDLWRMDIQKNSRCLDSDPEAVHRESKDPVQSAPPFGKDRESCLY